MKRKRCKERGSYYKVKDTEIKIKLNHKDIEAIEDMFFCKLTEKQYRIISPRIQKIWKQICNEEEKHSMAISKK